MRINRNIFKHCLILAIALFAVFGQNVFAAQQIDTGRSASLTIRYKIKENPVSGVRFRLFRVADVSSDGNYTLAGDFADYSVSLENLTNEGWRNLAETLAIYVSRDDIPSTDSGRTDASGNLTFSDQSTGLYLLIGDSHTSGNTTYKPQSLMVSLPVAGLYGTWNYNVTTDVKWDSEDYNPSLPTATPGPTSPSTTSRPSNPAHPSSSTVQRTVVKAWDDVQDKYGKRPSSIEVQLLRNGTVVETVTLNEANKWKHTWTGLSSSYDWTVAEVEVPDGYTVSTSRNDTTFTITNTYYDPENPPGATNPPTTTNPPSVTNPPGSTNPPGTEDTPPGSTVPPGTTGVEPGATFEPADGIPNPDDPYDPDNYWETGDGISDPGNPPLDHDHERYQEGPDENPSPKTGDENMLAMWFFMAALFATGAVWAIMNSGDKRRREQ